MNKLLIIIGLATAVTAQAQIGAVQTVVKSYPVTVGEVYFDITNNTSCTLSSAIIDCTGGKDVAIQYTQELSGAGTTANTVTLQASTDRVNWSTAAEIVSGTSFTITPAGTAVKTKVVQYTINGLNYLRVRTIANANANTGYTTNYSVVAFVK